MLYHRYFQSHCREPSKSYLFLAVKLALGMIAALVTLYLLHVLMKAMETSGEDRRWCRAGHRAHIMTLYCDQLSPCRSPSSQEHFSLTFLCLSRRHRLGTNSVKMWWWGPAFPPKSLLKRPGNVRGKSISCSPTVEPAPPLLPYLSSLRRCLWLVKHLCFHI